MTTHGIPLTWLDFAKAGCLLKYDASRAPTIYGIMGPASLCKTADAEISRRAEIMLQTGNRDRIASAPILERWGKCTCCGDPLDDGTGGECGWCIAARWRVITRRT